MPQYSDFAIIFSELLSVRLKYHVHTSHLTTTFQTSKLKMHATISTLFEYVVSILSNVIMFFTHQTQVSWLSEHVTICIQGGGIVLYYLVILSTHLAKVRRTPRHPGDLPSLTFQCHLWLDTVVLILSVVDLLGHTGYVSVRVASIQCVDVLI